MEGPRTDPNRAWEWNGQVPGGPLAGERDRGSVGEGRPGGGRASRGGGGPGGRGGAGRRGEVREDGADDGGIVDDGDDAQAGAATGTGQDIEIEHG